MKIAAIAAATMVTLAACAGTEAEAIELGNTGVGIGGKFDTKYDTGTEEFAMEFVPKASFTNWGVDFAASTTFDILELNSDDDIFKGLDLEAGYTIGNTGLRAYGEIGTDADFEFGDATVGVSFEF